MAFKDFWQLGGVDNSWNNVFVFVCDFNVKIIEGFDVFVVFLFY